MNNNQEEFELKEIFRGRKYDDQDVYKIIKDAIGMDIEGRDDYYIGYVGAMDDNGISETMYSDFILYKKNKKNKKGIQLIDPFIDPIDPIYDPKLDPNNTSYNSKFNQNNHKENNSNVFRITKRIKNRLTKVLALGALTASILAPFHFADKTVVKEVPVVSDTSYSYTNVNYDFIHSLTFDQIISEVNIGDKVFLPNGITVYQNSERHDQAYHIGDDDFMRDAGSYEITGFSLVVNGTYQKAIVNLDGGNVKVNLAQYVSDYCKQNNVDINDVDIMIHFGSDYDNTRTGWVSIEDVLNQLTLSTVTKHRGTINHFNPNATFITINTGVRIPIKDQNGNYYQPGTKVIGSDNQEYTINSLNFINKTDYNTSINYVNQEYNLGKELRYDINGISNLDITIVSLLVAETVASILATRRKNKKLEQTPFAYTIENKEEIENNDYRQLLKSVEQSREDYKKLSLFGKLKRLLIKEEAVIRNYTEDQMEMIETIIKNLSTIEYTYQKGDKILAPDNGRFYIERPRFDDLGIVHKKKIDITNLVIDRIKNIGRNNEILQTGELTDEKEEKYEDFMHQVRR